MLEIGGALEFNSDLRRQLAEFIPHPREDGIYWTTHTSGSGDTSLHSAPLHVGELLDKEPVHPEAVGDTYQRDP